MKNVWITVILLLSAVLSKAQCSGITLNVSETEVCAPGIVKYQVMGAPSGSSYTWNIGNGPVSGTDTFYSFHTSAEVVDVVVDIVFPSGGKCNITKNGAVNVYTSPKPEFSVSRTKLCDGPDTIALECLTPNLASISWVVDGTNYANYGKDLTHKFKSAGDKDIYLIVVDSNGCRGILEREDTVKVLNKVDLDITADNKNGCVPQKVNYSPEIKLNGESLKEVRWTFPGTNQTNYVGKNPPELIYGLEGNFDVTLEVETTEGCIHTLEKTDFVGFGRKFSPTLQVSDPHPCKNEPLVVSISENNPGKYIWDVKGADVLDTPSINKLEISYPDSGTYNVGLLHEYNGCKSAASLDNAVKVDEVHAVFYLKDHYHCKIPHTITLNDKRKASSYTNNGPLSYRWEIYEYGGSTPVFTSNNEEDSFTTKKWGRFDVKLIVTNANGCVDSLRRKGYIRIDSIRPEFYAVPEVACVGQEIEFRSTTPSSSYMSEDTFFWQMFDLTGKNVINEDSGDVVKYSYGKLGYYDVKLYAGNGIGCRDTLRLEDYIHIVDPTLDFTTDNPVVCEGDKVTLHQNSSPTDADFNHEWSIVSSTGQGDTIKLKGANPTFTAGTPGVYDVIYTANIRGGCEKTLVKKKFISVNGIRAEISADTLNGCEDMVVTLDANILYDYHISAPSAGITYEWTCSRASDVDIATPFASSTEVRFLKKGNFSFELKVINSTGCVYTVMSDTIVVGVQAMFRREKDIACVNAPLKLIQKSRYNPTNLTWKISPAGFKADIKLDVDTAYVTAREAGNFKVQLIADKYGVCQDTAEYTFEALEVISSFTMSDTQLYCAPAYAQFTATSYGADSFLWEFGDGNGVYTTDTLVANIYKRNSGWGKGYDITLISKSIEGCADTLFIEDAVKVLGPRPEFELKNSEGCEPLEVTFVDKGIDVFKYYLNYGDGSPLDSTHFDTHTYVTTTTEETQEFFPSQYAIDSLGCVSVYEVKDPVIVHKSPTLNVAPMDTSGCVPFNISFEDLTVDTDHYKWYVDTTLVSSTNKGSDILLDTGAYELKLVASNDYGCTTEHIQIIQARANPLLEIVPTFPRCLGTPISFSTELQAGGELVEWDWMFGDETTMGDTSGLENPDWAYTTPGIKMVTLHAKNIYGCEGDFSRELNISDPSNIPEGKIKVVTFNEAGDIVVEWYAVENLEIEKSLLYRDDVNDPVSSINANSLQTYYDDLPEAQPHCYHVRHLDACEFQSDRYEIHCPIWLTVSATRPFEIDLNWTAYQGWDQVDAYEIYRMDGNNPVRIAVVPATTLSYTHDKLCKGDYTYFVKGVSHDLETRSNSATATAIYVENVTPSNIELVTVTQEEDAVYVEWNESTNAAWANFVLLKYDPNDPTMVISEIPLTRTNYTDFNVKVDRNSYRYKVIEEDHCGLQTQTGLPGKSILLHGDFDGVSTTLNWSRYEEWERGVEKYLVQFRGNNGFETLAEVNPGTFSYIDADFHSEVQGEYCYRVIAVSNGPVIDSSYSNTTCTVGESQVHVPNAFTPDGDGINETFRPITQFARNYDDGTYRDYQFAIYNRWGEKVFESNNMEEGWDGTYMGRRAPGGVYMYTVTVVGIDSKIHKVDGQVLLYR